MQERQQRQQRQQRQEGEEGEEGGEPSATAEPKHGVKGQAVWRDAERGGRRAGKRTWVQP